MDIKTSDTRLLHRGYETLYNKPLFIAGDGETIYKGNCIEFNPNNKIFPYRGLVTTNNGLQVKCYKQLLDKWVYHNLIKGDD